MSMKVLLEDEHCATYPDVQSGRSKNARCPPWKFYWRSDRNKWGHALCPWMSIITDEIYFIEIGTYDATYLCDLVIWLNHVFNLKLLTWCLILCHNNLVDPMLSLGHSGWLGGRHLFREWTHTMYLHILQYFIFPKWQFSYTWRASSDTSPSPTLNCNSFVNTHYGYWILKHVWYLASLMSSTVPPH